MPPINPEQLLNALGPLLTNTGGIKGASEAPKIIGLMKVAKKLVNKCIYLNILRVTKSEEALDRFISLGGWDTLNLWLDNAKTNDNYPLIGELLEVYLNLPVTVGLLKQNSAAKTIKQLTKAENEKIKGLSSKLVDRWTEKIRAQKTSAENESDDKKKKKKLKEKEKERDREKEKEREKEKDKKKDKKEAESDSSDKSKNRDSSRKHHSSGGSSRDKDKDRRDSKEKERERDRHKDKERSRHDKSKSSSENREPKDHSSHSSSEHKSNHKDSNHKESSSSNKDSKKPLSSEDSSKNVVQSSESSIDQSKEEENPRRLKTVRKFGDKFRSTGLFDDDDEEEEKEDLKKKNLDKVSIQNSLKRASMEKLEEAADKKPRLHLTMPPINPVSLDGTGITTTTPPEVTHGRIKLIAPPKKGAHEIHESNVFMDALQSSTYTHGSMKRKKKYPATSPSTPTSVLKPTAPSLLPPSTLSVSTALSSYSAIPTHSSTTTATPETPSLSPPLLSPTSAMAQKLPSVPSFYRDTLDDLPEPEDNESKEAASPVEDDEKDESPPQLELMEVDQSGEGEKKEEDKPSEDSDQQTGSGVINGFEDKDNRQTEDMVLEEDVVERPNRPKKKVSWAVDIRLEEVFYFEMDETERENVNRPKSFSQMRKDEMMLDRRAMDRARRVVTDNMIEVLPWRHPKLIDDIIVTVEYGCNSVEKEIQMEREKSVLCALFFNKVPDTPIEPEPDIPGEQADTKDIPLEDENCSVIEHTYTLSDPSSLPYDPEYDMPAQGGPLHPQQQMMGGNMNMPNGAMGGGNMNGPMNGTGFHPMNNIPPGLSHLLNTLQQQARDNRDPIMANMQRMLANVVQNTNPQDSNLLMERILKTVEPFRHEIPGLSNLMNSAMNNGGGGMENNPNNPRAFMNIQGNGPRGMVGVQRHGLLGAHPPGYLMAAAAGNQRHPNMGGPNQLMGGSTGGGGGGNAGGAGGINPNFYPNVGGNMENMRMEGAGRDGGRDRDMGEWDRERERDRGDRDGRDRDSSRRDGDRGGRDRDGRGSHWRGKGSSGGGGTRRPFSKRGRDRPRVCQHFINKGCKYGENCSFFHPTGGSNSYDTSYD